jgi:HK97 family phage major capsid protein
MAGKTVTEQLVALKATRDEHQNKLKGLATSSIDEGRSMNTAEGEEFDTVEGEIKALDKDIERLTKLQAIEKATAQPVQASAAADRPANDGTRVDNLQLRTVEKLEPGIAFARYAMCLTKAKGNHAMAAVLAEKNYPHTEGVVKTLKAQAEGANLQELIQLKTAVAAGNTTDSTWAGPLVYAQTFMGDFLNYLRPRTLVGQAQFRPVPFNVRIGGQTSGGTANWVGQGKAKPVTKFDFNATTIPFTKVAAIAVITQELARFSDPAAEGLVRDSLADCVIAKIDNDLFDPDVAAVANVSPAGLLNGVAPVAGPATHSPDDIRAALMRLWAPWDSTFLGTRPAYFTTPAVARLLAFTRDSLGNPAFPGVTPTGGTLDGIPLRTSQYLANNGGSGGAPFILVDEAEIYLADDGSVTLDMSDQVSLEMSDAPTGSAGTPTATSLVSMWQTNAVAFRAERFIYWAPRRSGATQWIDGFPTS